MVPWQTALFGPKEPLNGAEDSLKNVYGRFLEKLSELLDPVKTNSPDLDDFVYLSSPHWALSDQKPAKLALFWTREPSSH